MKWSSRPVSKHGDWLRKIREEQGIRVKSLEDEPTLLPHLHWIWQAFTDLSFRRQAGMNGPQAISFMDIAGYCQLNGIIMAGEKERLCRHLAELDREYLSAEYERIKAETSGQTPSTPRPSAHRTQVPREPRRAPTREVR